VKNGKGCKMCFVNLLSKGHFCSGHATNNKAVFLKIIVWVFFYPPNLIEVLIRTCSISTNISLIIIQLTGLPVLLFFHEIVPVGNF